MLDKILVFISLVALFAFCGVVVTFVAEPDLMITTLLILFIASHDFWISVFRKESVEHDLEESTLESRRIGVSGRALPGSEEPTDNGAGQKNQEKKTSRKKAES